MTAFRIFISPGIWYPTNYISIKAILNLKILLKKLVLQAMANGAAGFLSLILIMMGGLIFMFAPPFGITPSNEGIYYISIRAWIRTGSLILRKWHVNMD